MSTTPIADSARQIPLAGPATETASAERGVLRFTTAGSVDDGKSTLIGRLLYDSQAVYDDQLASVRKSRINRSSGPLDLSLITDGLRAEREQGITIDVAYRYFSTPARKFIIADTPGHEQYTRNMATGASTADAAVILIDATRGVLTQTRRHAYISSLLGIRHLAAAVNKMDLVGFSQDVFLRIAKDFQELAGKLGVDEIYSVPVSALEGDNIVRRSSRTPWFEGPALLQHLERVPVRNGLAAGPLRFPVQYVIRPDGRFRGFAGQVVSGVLKSGMEVVALPSGRKTGVRSLVTFDGELESAQPGTAVTVTLEDEIDVSRGDLLLSPDAAPWVSRRFQAMLVWMDSQPFDPDKLYLVKHTTRAVRGRVSRIHYRVDVNSLDREPATALNMNDIAAVEMETTLPLFFDAYSQVRSTGSFILIDPISNATVAAGMIESPAETAEQKHARSDPGVSIQERRRRFGHSAGALWVHGRPGLAELIEQRLFEASWNVHLVQTDEVDPERVVTIAGALRDAGVFVLFSSGTHSPFRNSVAKVFGAEAFFDVSENEPQPAISTIIHKLQVWAAGLQRDAV